MLAKFIIILFTIGKKNRNKKIKTKEPQPMTFDERNKIYMEVMFGLMNIKVYEGSDISVWDLEEPDMKRFKVMFALYRDHGKEYSGEFAIQAQKRKLIYNLHNDRRKRTTAYISKKSYDLEQEISKEKKSINNYPILKQKQMVDLPIDPEELRKLREKEVEI